MEFTIRRIKKLTQASIEDSIDSFFYLYPLKWKLSGQSMPIKLIDQMCFFKNENVFV